MVPLMLLRPVPVAISVVFLLMIVSPLSDMAGCAPIGPSSTPYSTAGMVMPLQGAIPHGDLDGDGADDIILPYPDSDGGNGSVEIFFGISNGPGTKVRSTVDGLKAGSGIRVDDIDADGKDDLVIMDRNDMPYVVMGRSLFLPSLDLTFDDRFFDFAMRGLDLVHGNADKYPDMVFLDINGTLFLMEGPVSRSSVPVGFEMLGSFTDICGIDVDADGIDEIALDLPNGSDHDLLIMEVEDQSVIYRVTFSFDFRMMCGPDMDGDGCDDMVLLAPSASSYGSLLILSGSSVSGRSVGFAARAISGTADTTLAGPVTVGSVDLNADLKDELLVGCPTSDKGKGSVHIIQGAGSFFEDPPMEIGPADYSGDGSFMGLGRTIVSGLDLEADLREDVILAGDERLARLKAGSSAYPGTIGSGSFFHNDPDVSIDHAELGDRIGIRIKAQDRSTDSVDLMKATLICGTERSNAILAETGASSGDFIGHMTLGARSTEGRSISCDQLDMVSVVTQGWSGSLRVVGSYLEDDPPVYIGRTNIEVKEGSPFDMDLSFIEPEGENFSINSSGLPSWLGLNGTKLSGTPGNADVGQTTFIINASSGQKWARTEIELTVVNAEQEIVPIDFPILAKEGYPYRAEFQPISSSGSELRIVQSGPSSGWLKAYFNGSVVGIPRNEDVGDWNMTLVLDDGKGGVSEYNWSVTVGNTAPRIDPVSIRNWTEHEILTVDLNCTGEGDGLTKYTLLEGDVVSFDNITGVLTAVPWIISADRVYTARIMVSDGHGEDAVIEISIPLNNTAPHFLGSLPRAIKSWERTRILAPTDEDDIAVIGFQTTPFQPFMIVQTSNDVRYLELNPLNIDAGDREYILSVSDNWGGWRNYTWRLRIEPNGSAMDPEMAILSAKWDSRTELRIVFSIEPGNAEIHGARMSDENGLINLTLDDADRARGYLTVDVGDVELDIINITLLATFGLDGSAIERDIAISMVLRTGDKPSQGLDIVPFVMTAIVIIIIIVVLIGILVERTSYPLQVLLLKGGEPKDEEILSAIQARPGITWGGILRTTGVGRRTAASTIESLESGGYIYERFMGLNVRFYPMMGSFKDRPLSLTRYQGQIAKALLASPRGMDENDISAATGIPPSKVRKECSLLELKGAITIIRRPKLDVFRLSRTQRENLKRWAGE